MVNPASADPRPVPTIARDIDAEISARERVMAGLRADLGRLEGEVAQLRAARSAITAGEETRAMPAARGAAGPPKRRKPRAGSDAEVIREFAAEAMRRAGRPLNRNEVLTAMTEAGISLAAQDPALRIGRTLLRSDDYRSEKDGYWPVALPLPVPRSSD